MERPYVEMLDWLTDADDDDDDDALIVKTLSQDTELTLTGQTGLYS